MGGGGSGRDRPPELASLAARGLEASPVGEILVEESIAGWKEFELEVMRDADDSVVVCSIENVDPMGVHTGDSITVAPQQTLTDREFQQMRDARFEVLRVIGVETGGSNVQFAVDPATGRQVLIEMNPRVSARAPSRRRQRDSRSRRSRRSSPWGTGSTRSPTTSRADARIVRADSTTWS